MTRNSELDLDDLFQCSHEPEIAVSANNEIIYWVCRCGMAQVPHKEEKKMSKFVFKDHAVRLASNGMRVVTIDKDDPDSLTLVLPEGTRVHVIGGDSGLELAASSHSGLKDTTRCSLVVVRAERVAPAPVLHRMDDR